MKESEIIGKLRDEIKRLRSIIATTSPDLESLLKTRGLTIHKSQPPQDLLLPAAPHLDSFYRKLRHYSFRIFLRDVIKHQEQFSVSQVTRYTSPAKAGEYLTFCWLPACWKNRTATASGWSEGRSAASAPPWNGCWRKS
ncbi:MAG: hypothetical protein M0P70_17400 [Desulfobulbaceae bacterium]|nr:hypothetical protein [Desulfobulbaceae bacterium]